MPTGQDRQTEEAEISENKPAGQEVHLEEPVDAAYEPAEQDVQTEETGVLENEPAEQDVQPVEPDNVAYEPAKQVVQREEPVVLAYVPAAQAVHAVTVLSRKVPAWHGKTIAGMNVSPRKL